MGGFRFAFAILFVGSWLSAIAANAQTATPRFEHSECDFPLPQAYPRDLVRECGHLTVPEARGREGTRTYRLAVVTYKAKEADGSPPLLLLHGGPGEWGVPAGTRFVWGEMLFPLARKRDVIAFDMRGVGASEPRFCPNFATEGSAAFHLRTRREWEEAYRKAVRACVASMDEQKIDRTAFGADVNAADALDLRRALGIARWDIYGVSYGGLVVQELLRIDSEGTRAAGLISTVTTGSAYAAEFMPSYQRNLDRVFAQCREQPACARAFPTLERDFNDLYTAFTTTPVEVPAQGANPPRNVIVNGERFVMEFRQQLNSPANVARAPLMIHELRRGDRDAALRRLVGDGVISSWGPLGRVVQCNEYGATYRAAVAERLSGLRVPFRSLADDLREHCDLWLPKMVSRLSTRPVVSDVPALVVHGEYDPMDIPGTQRRMTERLSRAYTYTFPGETHANAPVGCHGLIVQQFLENPARAPDTSCLAGMPRIQFKTAGFQPTVTFVISTTGNVNTPFAGAWEANIGGGPDWTFLLETDGRLVRGALPERMLAITDGKIDGETLSFTVQVPDGSRTIMLTGRVQGDSLHFVRSVEIAPGGAPGGPGLLGGSLLRSLTARRLR